MNMRVELVPDGARGFDCNFGLTLGQARAFKDHGYEFVVRYLRRGEEHPFDLSTPEMVNVFRVGLKLMAVQHVESAKSWVPSDEKGARYGTAAVAHALRLGLPRGARLFCDLEGVKEGTPENDVIVYANTWHRVVSDAGFKPGLYVGWHAGLSPAALYHRLAFDCYWAAYNLNADQLPAVRGVAMHQWAVSRETRDRDVPPGITTSFDVDTVLADRLGGRVSWIVGDLDL